MLTKVIFEFATPREAREFLNSIPDAAPIAQQETVATDVRTTVEKAPRKPRTPKESAPVAPAPAASSSPAPVATQQEAATQPAAPAANGPTKVDEPTTPAPVAAAPTTDDAKAALEAVFNAKGFQGAQQLISTFGVSKLRDLPVEEYATFIAHAKGMVA
jgi:3-oxoacyl-ACP reductase-like protein